jgi:imidazolonepropionase
MTTLIINITELLQVRETTIEKFRDANGSTASIKNAYLLIKDDLIADFGPMISVPSFTIDLTIDATGKMMLPTWCDSHTYSICWQSSTRICG